MLMLSHAELSGIAVQVRRDILRMVHNVQSGHPGGGLGVADFLTCLYFNILDIEPGKFDLDGKGEDLFFLSNGHLSAAWYSVLARRGFFPVKELADFRKLSSRLQGHPSVHEGLPGIRIASGSLGQGLSVAIGAALSKKLNNDNHCIFCLMGDGEIQEGQVWEAAMYAAANKIDNLIGFIDYNGQQIDGPVEEVLSAGDLASKWRSFGWHVFETDGHNISTLEAVINEAKKNCFNEKPVMILLKTVMGKGVDFMEGSHKWHGVPPNDVQLEEALKQLPSELEDF